MGYRKLSARPRHHAQAEGAIEDFKKTSHAKHDGHGFRVIFRPQAQKIDRNPC
jgi:Winged helix-turn helix